ncbi:MAG: SCO family protein, partial [Gammaproteobacteria bacterium]|nr:SCO family protein [Gammaproteobacteria bacterium]
GESVGSDLLEGKWNLVFFGFTHCPDVCPLTLSTVRQAVDEIRKDSSVPDPQVVFVSVDPKRDTPEKLNQYVAFFDPSYIGLTGELNNIYELTRPMNIVVQFTADEENPESYTVDHTASIFLIDPQLRVRGSFKGPHETEIIIDDYKTLLEGLTAPS